MIARSGLSRVAGAFTALVLAFILLPLAVVVLFAFNSSASVTFPITGLSLHWFSSTLSDSVFRGAAQNSILVACLTTVITVVAGTAAAFGFARSRAKLSRGMNLLIVLTLAFPPLLIGVGLSVAMSRLNVSASLPTVIVGHVAWTLPFYYLLADTAVRRLDPAVEDAVQDLGANAWNRFRHGIAPRIAPAVIGGAMLTFLLSLDEFLITNFTVGAQETVPVFVFGRINRTIDPTINAISTMLLVAVAVFFTAALVANAYLSRRSARRATPIAEDTP